MEIKRLNDKLLEKLACDIETQANELLGLSEKINLYSRAIHKKYSDIENI